MMNLTSFRKPLVVALLTTSALIAYASAQPETAEAHKVTRGVCASHALKKTRERPPATRREYRARYRACLRFASRHNTSHLRIRIQYARKCSRMSSSASYQECYRLGLSAMPLSWTVSWDLHKLLRKESGWNPSARNPSSGACGLFQFLPCRASGSVRRQGDAGYLYIKGRYGNPAGAWGHFTRRGWY
ncbi:MAG: hypothetical protein DRI46_12040 [Chloroflexi bacterium]|nr:MAG: hypothetical protein DRI46_12040 [Chloroflexota bacterium]